MKFVTALLAWMPLAQACISDLNEIVQIEEELTDDTELRVYKLCPHTTYDLADSFEPDGTARNGQHPLLMGRSNILVQCGDDGKSEDDCVLRGGLFQLGFLDEFETGRPVENATIRGITFQQALSMNVLIQHTGDLTIEDCIFRGNRNVANVLLDAPTTPVRRRDLGSQEVLEDVARRTETANLDNMNLVITKSLFQVRFVWVPMQRTIIHSHIIKEQQRLSLRRQLGGWTGDASSTQVSCGNLRVHVPWNEGGDTGPSYAAVPHLGPERQRRHP